MAAGSIWKMMPSPLPFEVVVEVRPNRKLFAKVSDPFGAAPSRFAQFVVPLVPKPNVWMRTSGIPSACATAGAIVATLRIASNAARVKIRARQIVKSKIIGTIVHVSDWHRIRVGRFFREQNSGDFVSNQRVRDQGAGIVCDLHAQTRDALSFAPQL